MIIPGILAQRRAAGVAPTLWTPLNMTTVPQIYLDAHDSVITNVSGFASAISNLGAMGSNGDFSQATSGFRPQVLSAEVNGKRALRFDGTDDRMTGGSTQQKALTQNVSNVWVFSVVKKRTSDAATRALFAASVGTGAGTRVLARTGASSPANTPALAAARVDGGAAGVVNASVAVAGSYYLFSGDVNFATRAGSVYVNGDLSGYSATMMDSAGPTSDTPSQEPLVIGAFASQTAAFSDMDLAALIVSNTALSAGDRQKLEGWAAHKYGLTANLPSGHPYKTVAPTV